MKNNERCLFGAQWLTGIPVLIAATLLGLAITLLERKRIK